MSTHDSTREYPLARSFEDKGERVFVPEHFTFDSDEEMLKLISAYPMAQVFTSVGGEHRVTSVPIVIPSGGSAGDTLELIGHIARRNPQVEAIHDQAKVTAVFMGPSAYVSPRWFTVKKTVSTWNYMSVQAHGTLQPVADADETLEVLRHTIAHLEHQAHPHSGIEPWTMTEADPELVDRLSQGITAFRMVVSKLEGVKRLNQDKHLTDILGIMAGLGRSPQPGADDTVRAMAENLNNNSVL